jgi:hypothetical protein
VEGSLEVDLTEIDRATRAHELTLETLGQFLLEQGLELRLPTGASPKFDGGWRTGSELFIAEVKTISDANESQQVRLGLGQILDYGGQLRRQKPMLVLVLDRRPSISRWGDLVNSHGVTLTFPPNFEALRVALGQSSPSSPVGDS